MKHRFTIGLLLCLCLATARAQSVINATISVTNAPTTNGQTLVINGVTRTWTNSVQVPAVQILTNATAAGSATNLFNQLSQNPVPGGTALSYGSSTGVVVRSFPGQTITVTLSAGWGLVTYATNTLSPGLVVRVPYTVEAGPQQTNIWSAAVNGLNQSGVTNPLLPAATVASLLVGTTNHQTGLTGNKTWTGSNYFSNVSLVDPRLTNGVNYGNAFRSPGSGSASEQFGTSASASGASSVALGNGAAATNTFAVAIGQGAQSGGSASIAVGTQAAATNAGSIMIGGGGESHGDGSIGFGQAFVYAKNGIGIGNTVVDQTHTNSVAIGSGTATTKKNQIVLGSAIYVVTIPGSAEHLITTGTNSFSDIAFRRYAITSLANGNNAGVIIGTNTFVQVSGPSGAFTINGMTGSPNRDGHVVIVLNRTGQNMTIANDSGTDPTAANRIYTLTGADVGPSTGDSCATFVYNAADARWILTNWQP